MKIHVELFIWMQFFSFIFINDDMGLTDGAPYHMNNKIKLNSHCQHNLFYQNKRHVILNSTLLFILRSNVSVLWAHSHRKVFLILWKKQFCWLLRGLQYVFVEAVLRNIPTVDSSLWSVDVQWELKQTGRHKLNVALGLLNLSQEARSHGRPSLGRIA